MAKKASAAAGDRKDPNKNKSLAIRLTLGKMPRSKAKDIVAAVKRDYGHDIKENMVYMVKTKKNMAKRSKDKPAAAEDTVTLSSPTEWVVAIRLAKQLLGAAGSESNAIALVKAVS